MDINELLKSLEARTEKAKEQAEQFANGDSSVYEPGSHKSKLTGICYRKPGHQVTKKDGTVLFVRDKPCIEYCFENGYSYSESISEKNVMMVIERLCTYFINLSPDTEKDTIIKIVKKHHSGETLKIEKLVEDINTTLLNNLKNAEVWYMIRVEDYQKDGEVKTIKKLHPSLGITLRKINYTPEKHDKIRHANQTPSKATESVSDKDMPF
jgi:hypothetical protein